MPISSRVNRTPPGLVVSARQRPNAIFSLYYVIPSVVRGTIFFARRPAENEFANTDNYYVSRPNNNSRAKTVARTTRSNPSNQRPIKLTTHPTRFVSRALFSPLFVYPYFSIVFTSVHQSASHRYIYIFVFLSEGVKMF